MTAIAPASLSTANAPPLGKFLASSDKKTRDKAVKSLAHFLSSQTTMDKLEMDKLWKGIFYCFWMSDKPLVQQALASELAEILLTLTTVDIALMFLRGFWECTVREWNGIDRLRIDKYYMLIRRYVNATFRLLLRENWESDVCARYNIILTSQGGPLCPSDVRVPASLSYHLADIYLEELNKAIGENPSTPVPLPILLSPFLRLAAQTNIKLTFKRVEETIFDPLLSQLDNEDKSDDESYPNIINNCCTAPGIPAVSNPGQIRKAFLRWIFEIASEADTKDSNRRKMYALWEAAGGQDEDDD